MRSPEGSGSGRPRQQQTPQKPGYAASARGSNGKSDSARPLDKPDTTASDSANKEHRINIRFRTAKSPAHKKSVTLASVMGTAAWPPPRPRCPCSGRSLARRPHHPRARDPHAGTASPEEDPMTTTRSRTASRRDTRSRPPRVGPVSQPRRCRNWPGAKGLGSCNASQSPHPIRELQ